MKRKRTVVVDTARFAFVCVAAGMCIMGIVWFLSARITSAAPADTRTSTRLVRVEKGDSLWSIASEYCSGNTSAAASEIAVMNGISSSVIHEGDMLIVPVTR